MKATVMYTVDIPDDWFAYSDQFFSRAYSGYWAFGVNMGDCWLVFEQADDARPSEELIERAERCFGDHVPLPDGWHVLDKHALEAAYVEGCKRWGADWFETKGDAETYDVVLQLALLGEVRYG